MAMFLVETFEARKTTPYGLDREKPFPAVESAYGSPHSSGDTPQRPDAG